MEQFVKNCSIFLVVRAKLFFEKFGVKTTSTAGGSKKL